MTSIPTITKSTIMPGLRYVDAPSAMEWLCRVLGFERHAVYPGPDGAIAHAELTLNGGMVMLGSQRDDEFGRNWKSPKEVNGMQTCVIYVVVPDVGAAYQRALSAGASIVRPIEDTHYGSREFALRDLEGYTWSVGSYDPWAKQE